MTQTLFMPGSIKPFELKTRRGRMYRSHSLHQTVKNCIEGTYLDSAPSYHIGFSPSASERIFLSLLRGTEDRIQLMKKNLSKEEYIVTKDIPIEKGETYLVCLDSEKKILLAKYGETINTAKYNGFDHENEWYAYFDGGVLAEKQDNHVLMNLGYTAFKNSLPDGYFPWNYNISDLRGI